MLYRATRRQPTLPHGAFLGEAVTIIALPDNLIRKGQIEGVGKGNIRGQGRFVSNLFMIAA